MSDREIDDAVSLAYDAACMGADAFIVQDLGLARALKKTIPEITLHASTQCACHSYEGAKMLAEAGFERVVLARELDCEEIRKIGHTRRGNRGVCPRRVMRLPFGLVPYEFRHRQTQRQPRPLRPTLPFAVQPFGRKAEKYLSAQLKGSVACRHTCRFLPNLALPL